MTRASILHDRNTLLTKASFPAREHGLDKDSDYDYVIEAIKVARNLAPVLTEQLFLQYELFSPSQRRAVHTNLFKTVGKWGHDSLVDDDLQYLLLVLHGVMYERYYPEVSSEEILQQGPRIFAYDPISNDRIYFLSSLAIQEDQHIFKGRRVSTDAEVVVKWVDTTYDGPEYDIQAEIDCLQLVRKLGVKTFDFSSGFLFWNSRVLVMELLTPLNPTIDDPYQVALSLLQDLRLLHAVGVHSDIKPDNIMKRISDDPSKEVYFLIDYGGLATERLLYGFKRHAWSPLWTSQVQESNQVTTGRNDLFELGYTLNGLLMDRNGRLHDEDYTPRIYRSVKIKQYMERVWNIDERNITSSDYDDLEEIVNQFRV